MISTPIQIRFGDCDMGGHVHNAAYLHYFESARINFFIRQIGKDWDWKNEGFILKKNTIEYHSPTYIEDQIEIEVSCVHIGSKSFTLSYHVKDANGVLKAYGESVVVCFNYSSNSTILVPKIILGALEQHFTK